MTDHEALETDVAIVGMSGRFPGAKDVDILWDRVRAGEDCLTDLSRRDVAEAGVDPSLSRSPDYVLRAGLIEGVENFDAGFFGFSDRDASIMDPQHRHFIECAWEALEAAAHVPELFDGSIGIFGGAGMNTYLLNNLLTNPNLVEQLGWFLLRHTSNDKDFLTTTVSYKLGLTGPSVNVQTACSTSLVATHLAAQSLLNYECDLALAGGTTIEFPQTAGYEYREGEILSPTGRCLAFDAGSAGTVLTSGVAVVALRRLADAIEGGDPILAVIKASAINNDGNRKVGYLAPSVDGHADAVAEALALGDIDPRTIGLLEAHGTGTSIGDPIELAALTEAFRTKTDETGFCRLTSTKPNIGHLDTAAGGASLIKVVQALRHQTLPPMANHTGPNPLLEIEKTPFVLSDRAEPWPSDGLRRAGVSSLGVGGTNAHVIVEEAPTLDSTPPAVPGQVLALSGNSSEAVDEATENLASFIERNPDANLADVANTLVKGRRAMGHRRIVVATDAASAPDELRSRDQRLRRSGEVAESAPKVVFSFPGGGAQYAGMASGLDDRFEEFHAVRRQAVDAARRLGHPDPEALVALTVDEELLQRPTFSLPAVFIASAALARQWMAWGVEPDAMIGHSLGEYVAAHVAGVMSFEDALELVLVRSALMERVSSDQAAMLVVPLPPSETASELEPSLSLAVVNAEDEHVVAGPADAITGLADDLHARGVEATRIPLAAAAHSSMLDPVLDEFRQAVRSITLQAPKRPYISNLTGDWIGEDEPVDPEYWVRHLRNTVQYHTGLQTVLSAAPSVLVELGPGQSLSSYARRTGLAVDAVPVLRHPKHEVDDVVFTLGAFSQLWLHGVEADIGRFAGVGRRKLTLPTYPFQRRRHWIEPGQGTALAKAPVDLTPKRIDDVNDMGLRPVWQVAARPPATDTPITSWAVIGGPLSTGLTTELTERGCTVSPLSDFDETADVEEQLGQSTGVILVADPSGAPEATLRRWLDQTTAVTRALASADGPARVVALTKGALAARGDASSALDAAALGPVLVGPKEYDTLSSALVDLDPEATEPADAVVADEILSRTGAVAIRGSDRLVSQFEMANIADELGSGIRDGGTYLVTGGLGGIGSVLAAHLAVNHAAGLILTSSVETPAPEERDQFLRHHASNHPMCRRIRQIKRLEALGGKVETLTVDLTDPVALRAALDEANRSMGPLDGCIHAAGRLRDRPMELATSEDSRFVVEPKALAALVLAEELERRGAELLVLISSTSTELAPEGQTAYVAANAVLDAMAGTAGGLRIATLNYGMWSELGMAAEAADRSRLGLIDGDRVDHPVLSEVSTDRRGTVTVVGELRTDHHWVVDEHRTRSGAAILPGTGHIELYLAAMAAAGERDVDLVDVILFEPLVVDGPVQVRVVIESDDDGNRTLRLDSDQGTGSAWTTHSEAGVGPHAAGPDQLDVAAVESRCRAQGLDPIAATGSHLDLGPRWSSTIEAGLGDGEAAAVLELDMDDGPGWLAHPALVDVATGVGVQLADQGRGLLHVPVGYDRVASSARLPNRCNVHAQLLASNDPDVARVDLTLADQDGAIVLRVDGLQLRALADATVLADANGPDQAAGAGIGTPGPGGLLELTSELGLRADEGTRWFDSLVAGPDPRLIATSVDLEDLRDFASRDEPEPGQEGTDSEPVDPASGIDAALQAIWQELLGVNEVGMDDDFFDLGGHSLIAIRLMARIKRDFSVRLDLTTLFEASTVATLAELIAAERPDLTSDGATEAAPQSSSSRHLVVINGNGTKRPIYIVHGAGGNVMFLLSLSRALGQDYPLFGFQALGINEGEIPDSTVEAMAERYVTELRERAPGPYVLGGYSGGGVVALEMVRLLQAAGEQVDRVILFDSVPSGKAMPDRLARWKAIATHAVRLGPKTVQPYLRGLFLNQVRRFFPEPDRRLEQRKHQERELGIRDTTESGFINLFDYFSATADRYDTGRYAVDATVLKADYVWPTQPRDYHWTGHIDGRLDWRTVPGDHHSMFYPTNAPALSDAVKATLETLDPLPEGPAAD